jgi:hypothetical protein
MYPKLDYDIEKDFVPLVLMANVPQVLVVNPKSVAGDFKAFLAQLKASPGRLNYRCRHGYLAPPGGRTVQAADRNLNHPYPLHRRRPSVARPDRRPGGHDV